MEFEMSQEKYMQHYMEILTATMTDCIVRNVSMQANAKIKDELVEQLNEKILEFKEANEELAKAFEELRNEKEKTESESVKSLNMELTKSGNELSELRSQVSLLTRFKNECESMKSQLIHLETFRKELVKERENHESTKIYYENKIKELNEELESLKSPPKRKKLAKKPETFELIEQEEVKTEESTVKDGGIF